MTSTETRLDAAITVKLASEIVVGSSSEMPWLSQQLDEKEAGFMAAPKTQTQTDVLANPLTVRLREAARLLVSSERLVWNRERTTSDGPQETAVVSGLQREMRCDSCVGAFGTPRKSPRRHRRTGLGTHRAAGQITPVPEGGPSGALAMPAVAGAASKIGQ